MGTTRSRKRTFLILTGVMVIILLLLTSLLIVLNTSPTIELGELNIDIRSDRCNVTAKLLFSPDIETRNEHLVLVLENAALPINYSEGLAVVILEEDQFREIMDEEEIRIVGEVEARPLPFWQRNEKVDQTLDLSFISDLVDSIEISNMKLEPSPPTSILLEFDLTADIEHDVTIRIIDTEAKIRAGTSEHAVLIKDLLISTDMIGHGSIEVRSSTLLALSLYPGNVEIDAWGITVEFDLPIDI